MNLIRRATKLALVLSPVVATPMFAQGPQKIAYVDSKVILSRAPGRQAAEDQFNKEMEASRGQVQKMGDSLQTIIADYQKAQATLAANVREQREAAIRKKQEDYQTRAGALDQQMQQRQMELVKPIMDQIRKVLDEIRQEDGYAFILDAGSDAGVIVAADRNLDITEKVITRLKPVPITAAAPGARQERQRRQDACGTSSRSGGCDATEAVDAVTESKQGGKPQAVRVCRTLTASDIAEIVGGTVAGNGDAEVRAMAPLDRATEADLSFLANATLCADVRADAGQRGPDRSGVRGARDDGRCAYRRGSAARRDARGARRICTASQSGSRAFTRPRASAGAYR